MEWQTLDNVEVGTNRFVDARWRVEEDEMEIKMFLQSDHIRSQTFVSPGIDPSGYEQFAILMVKALHSLSRKP